jgi:hypothetical protein
MKSILLAVLIGLCPALPHAEETLALIRPDATRTLAVQKLEGNQGLLAEFDGRMTVTGVLVVQWIEGVDEEADNTLDVRLVPDAKAIARIPYFDRYPVRKIDIENEAEALCMVIPTKVLARLKRKELKIVRATGAFVLENYVHGVECDASWARAKVVSAEIPRPLALAGTRLPFGC